MKKRKTMARILGGLLVLLLIAAGIFFAFYKKSWEECWSTGDVPLIYKVSMNETDGQSTSSRLDGRLQLNLKRSPLPFWSANTMLLEGQFKPLSFRSGGQSYDQFRDFTYAFHLEVNARCQVQNLEFDGRETFSARRTIQRLVRILALGQGGVIYQDFLGEAHMILKDESPDGHTFVRTGVLKAAPFTKAEEFMELQEIKKSEFRYEGPKTSLWYPHVFVDEQLVFLAGPDKLQKSLNYTVDLNQSDEAPLAPLLSVGKAYAVNKSLSQDFKGKDRPSLYDNRRDTKDMPRDIKEAIDRFRSLLTRDDKEAKADLVDFLKSHPEAIKDLKSMIETEVFSDEELIQVLFALAKVASPEAQEAMADLIRNEGLDKGTRLRTIFAVSEIRLPDEGVIAAVRSQYQALLTGSQTMDELQSTALLGGGLLASNLRDVMPGQETKILDDIERVYSNALRPEIKANAIDAMGNTANEVFSEILEKGARSSSELERKASYEALSRVPTPAREELLIQSLTSDTVSPARLAALQTLKTIGLQDARSVELLKTSLAREPDSVNRVVGVQVLGSSIRSQITAKPALIEAVKKEQDPSVLQAAGRYLSAYELLEAKKQSNSGSASPSDHR